MIVYLFNLIGFLSLLFSSFRYAFIEFDDYRDADDAVYDLHGTEFMGERVTVELARGTPHGRYLTDMF